MDKLRSYLRTLKPSDQVKYAERAGTSIGYLRKWLSLASRSSPKTPKLGESIAIGLDRESGGAVPCTELRPDVDWAYLRGTSLTTTNRKRA